MQYKSITLYVNCIKYFNDVLTLLSTLDQSLVTLAK